VDLSKFGITFGAGTRLGTLPLFILGSSSISDFLSDRRACETVPVYLCTRLRIYIYAVLMILGI